MSTIRVDNFGPSSGGTTYSARGIAKAWVNFNGTGTIAIHDSENVASLVDDAVGQYYVNLSNAMSSTNSYGVTGSSGEGTPFNARNSTVTLAGTTASQIYIANWNGPAGAARDAEFTNATIHGDLA